MALAKKPARLLTLAFLLRCLTLTAHAADARFDLVGPRIDVRVTRSGVTLPIASVPNLQPGDKLWIHPDLPATQSVRYLLIVCFLRGTTNPPPEDWFVRIETWQKKVREEGTFVTVPAEAQQALLFMAPETGGDFSTLRSAVRGRPGAFVRASQDLIEAGFEQARIEKYVADIRRVPPSDPADLQKHSDLLARTLALKPNVDCFKRPPDTQFTCLTQSGSQLVLDDGHGQNIVNALSNGPGSDLINQASYTQAFGAGVYSAYVGAIVDLVRIMSNLHTAQYQYIPAISFPQAEAMNLRLNTPPSFHNPKSVLVIALPSVQLAAPPPLRSADATYVACLIKPSVTLPIEGAPLVFSTDFAHELTLHLNTPPNTPTEPDIPLIPDAYFGGLIVQRTPQHHIPLHDPLAPTPDLSSRPEAKRSEDAAESGVPGERSLLAGVQRPAVPTTTRYPDPSGSGLIATPKKTGAFAPTPTNLTGTIYGRWGFDAFTGPTVQLQQLPGTGWHIIDNTETGLVAGHPGQLLLISTGTACVHTITARPSGLDADATTDLTLLFKPATPATPRPGPQPLAITLPVQAARDLAPGMLDLSIQQYEQPAPDKLSARTFAEPAHILSAELHAGDRSLLLRGTRLNQIDRLKLGDLTFLPPADALDDTNALRLALTEKASPNTHLDEHLTAHITLHDGRVLTLPLTVSAPRPVLTLLRKSIEPAPNTLITLASADDVPLTARLTFTLKLPGSFPRTGQIEIETLDGTLRTVLTLAPSGGLMLQDPHTVVATLDPLRSFGQSAFGALHLRAVFPRPTTNLPPRPESPTTELSSRPEAERSGDGAERPAVGPPTDLSSRPEDSLFHRESGAESGVPGERSLLAGVQRPAVPLPATTSDPTSDWLPLATLVRLPTLTQIQCTDTASPTCTLTGASLFLLESLSTDPTFATPTPIPDGYTGTTLTIPHPIAATLFLKLRDDPATTASAILPVALSTPPSHRTPTTQKSPASLPSPSANTPSQ